MITDTTNKVKHEKSEVDLIKSIDIIMRAGKTSLWRYDVEERKFYSVFGNILVQDGATYEQCAEALTKNSRAEYHRLFDRLISGKSSNEGAVFHFINSQTGKDIYYRSELAVDVDEQGKIISVLGTQIDVTQDVIQKRALEDFKIKTDLINEKNCIIQWDFNLEGHTITTTGSGAVGRGRPMDIDTYIQNVHPENKDVARDLFNKMANREINSFDVEARANLPGYDDYRNLFVSGVAIKDNEGNIINYTGIRRDITNESMQQKELVEKRYKTDLVKKASGLTLWEYDCKKHIFISDDNILYGVEQTFQDYLDATHPLYKDKVVKVWDILGSNADKSFSLEWKYLRFGEWKYAIVAGEPYEKDENGVVTRYLGYRRDTTDLVLMNESIRYSKFKTEMAIKNANMVMWEYDVEEKMFTAFNDPLTDYDESAKYSTEDFISMIDPSSVIETERAVAFMNSQEVGEFIFNCKIMMPNSVNWQYIRMYGSCLEVSEYDPTKAIKYVGLRVDNTALVKSTKGMEELNDLISNILTQSPSIIFVKDISDNFRYVIVNDMFCQFFNMIEKNVIGKIDDDIFSDDVAQRINRDDKCAVDNGTYSLIETIVVNGKSKSLHTTKREVTTNGRRLLVCIASEITEAIEQQKELEIANAKSELVLLNANAGFVYIDNNFRIIWENVDSIMSDIPYAKKYKRDTICYESVHGLDRPCDNCVLLKASNGLKAEKRTKFVDDRVFEINATPVIDKNGQPNGCVCRVDDVTDDYKQRSALEKTQKYLDLAIDAGNVAVWGYDPGKEVVFNISGKVFDKDVLSIEEANEFIYADDRVFFDEIWQKVVSGESEKEVICLRFKNPITGKIEYIDKSIVSLRTESGELSMIIGTHRDVTEEKLRKTALEESRNAAEEANALLQSIIQQIPFGLYIKDVDSDFKYVIMNDVLAKIDGINGTDAIGKTDHEIFDKEMADMFYQESICAANKPEGELSIVKMNIEKEDKTHTYENFDTVITVSNGKRLLVGVVSDVTERDEMIRDLRDAKEKAEQSDKLKSAFLANMSHEIRTPLNAIVGFSELLADAENREEKEEYSNIISVNNELLLRLIGDILDLSKIESGMIDLKPDEFDVADNYDEIFAMIKQKGVKPNVNLVIENPYRSCVVKLDKNRFNQVVINFITNAVKYTEKGKINMGYKYIDNGIAVYVEDTGIGIAKENHHKIFERFEKLDTFAQGTGLGLSICKAILEAQGGQIGYKDREDGGSIFWAWFPCEADINASGKGSSQCYDELPKPRRDNSKFKILIAEDNDSNYLLVQHMLKGFDLVRVSNGAEAVDSVKNGSFDIVLMDWKMPVMDGLEATQKIREFNQIIPIVAVTANSFDSDIAKITEAGCTDFVAKPLKKQVLINAIEKYKNG